MSTISLSDLEFITRESLASDFKSSGSALPPNTAVVDVRKPFLQQTCLRNHNTNLSSQSRYETAITSAATSKAQLESKGEVKEQSEAVEKEGEGEQKGPSGTQIKKQKVYVLQGGFTMWQEKYGQDKDLTEGYQKDIWEFGTPDH